MYRALIVALGLMLLSLTGAAQTEQWPKFRGLNAGAIPDDPNLPDTWSETENVVWKTDIPGLGWSSPIVWDNHIFVTATTTEGQEPAPVPGLFDPGDDFGAQRSTAVHRWMVYDVDFQTGELRWERRLHQAVPPITRHIKNSFASETPVTDGKRVYVYFGSIGLVIALTMEGETVWTQELGAYNGRQAFAPASSPVLHQDRLYVSSTTTRQPRFLPRSTRRRVRKSGGLTETRSRTGRRRSCGRTTCELRS